MLKSLFSNSVTIPVLRLSGVIGQAGMFRSGLTSNSLDKLINKLFSEKKSPSLHSYSPDQVRFPLIKTIDSEWLQPVSMAPHG